MAEGRFSRSLRRAGGGLLLLGFLLALTTSEAQEPVPAQKKYRLRNLSAAGDSRTVDDVMDMQLDMVLTLEGQEVPMKFALRTREAYTVEILALKESAALIRRKYTAHRQAETTPDGQTKVKVSSFQGKTVTIRVHGRKVTVTTDKSKLLCRLQKILRHLKG